MIPKVSTYEYSSPVAYKPSFGAVIPKGRSILIKRRGEYVPQNLGNKMFEGVKDMFFEMFPKLDPEFKKVMNLKV